jgi:hypothetical protein
MKKYKLVHVKFLDHAMSDGESIGPFYCEAVGYLIKEDELCYYIAPWIANSQINTTDTEIFTIVKHTSLEMKELVFKRSR